MQCPLCGRLISEEEEICQYCEESDPDYTLDGFSILEESKGTKTKDDPEEDDYIGSSLEAANKTVRKILKKHPTFDLHERDEEEIVENRYEFHYEGEDTETNECIRITIETNNDGKVIYPKGYFIVNVDSEQFAPFKRAKKKPKGD